MKLFIFALSIVSILAGCAQDTGSKGGGNGGDNVDQNDLGYNPSDRWQDVGSYSYEYRENINGISCQAKQSFDSLAGYCMGLQNQELNNSCALNSRKMSYERLCGNDFQEINFRSPIVRSGFDDRLQKSCRTGNPATSTFKTTKQYCEFLKDETLHEQCFWDMRRHQFVQKKCFGNFSAEPTPVAAPAPQPAPEPPSSNPAPAPVDPLDQIAVVKELRAAGIEVEVDWQAIRRDGSMIRPGEKTVEEKLQIFWLALEVNKAAIIARKNLITQLRVSLYTNYHSYSGHSSLTLDYESTPGDLAEYFPLFDQALAYEKQLGIDFGFIQSGSSRDPAPYLPLKTVLSVVQKNLATLQKMKGVISKLEIDSYSAYWSANKVLRLNYANIEGELIRYIQVLKPLGPVYGWASANSIDLDFDFDINKQSSEVYRVVALIEKELPSLSAIAKAGLISKLEVQLVLAQQSFYQSLKQLSIGFDQKNDAEVVQAIRFLGGIANRTMELKIPIKIYSSDINQASYTTGAQLDKLVPQIKYKLSKIKTISLGGSSSVYYASLQELVIGESSTVEETKKIISGI